MKELLSSPEANEMIKFTGEQKALLKNKGYAIFLIAGHSIKELKEKGLSVISEWHKGLKIEGRKSRTSEVAIKLDNPFLPNSSNLTTFKQLVMTSKFSSEMAKEIPGVRAVVGSASDYAEIYKLHSEKQLVSLFRYGTGNTYAITTDLTREGNSIFVGEHYSENVIVSYRLNKNGDSDIKVLPLVIPD